MSEYHINQSLKQLHIDKFDMEPVITGINYWHPEVTTEGILKAIKEGAPYVEEDVPEETLI